LFLYYSYNIGFPIYQKTEECITLAKTISYAPNETLRLQNKPIPLSVYTGEEGRKISLPTSSRDVSSRGEFSTTYIFSIARKSGLELNKEKDLHIFALENAEAQFYDMKDERGELYLKPAGEYYYKYYSGHGCGHSTILNKNDRMVERGEGLPTASFNEIVLDVKDAFRSKGPKTEIDFVMNQLLKMTIR
jgi:hypothetical protein